MFLIVFVVLVSNNIQDTIITLETLKNKFKMPKKTYNL